MAEPIGLASGLITLATFAFQSSIALYETVQSFQSHPQRVRGLLSELDDLSGVLRSLKDTISADTDTSLSALLLRCGKACEEFKGELLKRSSRSKEGRKSFRDWAKLQYMGENIDGFTHLLAGYKSTINIAIADATLRKSSVTAESLEKYRNLIKDATDDLEEHLQSIDEKLDLIFARKSADSDAAEVRQIQEERLSTQKSLQICAQLSEYIDQLDLRAMEHGQGSSADSEDLSERIMSEGMQQFKTTLDDTRAKLEERKKELMQRFMDIVNKPDTTLTQAEKAEIKRLNEELESTRQGLDICNRAEHNSKENISVIDNDASGDETIQFLVSTSNKTIHGKNRGHGVRIRQVGGHIDSTSLQQISRDISKVSAPGTRSESSTSQGDISSDSNDATKKESNSGFNGRYGRGMTLEKDELNNSQSRSGGGAGFVKSS